MNWTQSHTLVLAGQKCSHCFGIGLVVVKGREPRPCQCVLRRIFRICLQRFRYCSTAEPHIAHMRKLQPSQPMRYGGKGRPAMR